MLREKKEKGELSWKGIPEHTAMAAPTSWHQSSDYSCFILGPHSFAYSLPLRLPHAPNFIRFLLTPPPTFFLPFPPLPSLPSLAFFSDSLVSLLMPVDTVVDLRQRAGDLAHRLGYLSHFISAAQELLDIIHHLSSEILLRHNRKVGSEARPLVRRRY